MIVEIFIGEVVGDNKVYYEIDIYKNKILTYHFDTVSEDEMNKYITHYCNESDTNFIIKHNYFNDEKLKHETEISFFQWSKNDWKKPFSLY